MEVRVQLSLLGLLSLLAGHAQKHTGLNGAVLLSEMTFFIEAGRIPQEME